MDFEIGHGLAFMAKLAKLQFFVFGIWAARNYQGAWAA